MVYNAVVQCIKVVQCTIDDFYGEKPKTIDELACEKLSKNLKVTGFSQLAMLNNDHFGEVNPVCPECGSVKHVKNGFRERHPTFGDFGKITVYVQRYICKKCGKKFSARIDGIVKK